MAWGKINITGGAVSGLPDFTYTGVSQLFDDGTGNWRIKFLTSGTLTPLSNLTVDIFCVGGGGSGGRGGASNYGSGGGGGYTSVVSGLVLVKNSSYVITVGAGGANLTSTGYGKEGAETTVVLSGSTIASALGGHGGTLNGTPTYPASAGGSGGSSHNSPGGTPGGSNGSTPTNGGTGQGTTTREFHEVSGELYAGGGGGCHYTESRNYGGAGGGGNGAVTSSGIDATAGVANTGGGGGGNGAGRTGGSTAGGSGIFILRNHRA